jgi:hypothetical protein
VRGNGSVGHAGRVGHDVRDPERTVDRARRRNWRSWRWNRVRPWPWSWSRAGRDADHLVGLAVDHDHKMTWFAPFQVDHLDMRSVNGEREQQGDQHGYGLTEREEREGQPEQSRH